MPRTPRSRWIAAAFFAVLAFGLSAGFLATRDGMGRTFEFPEYADIARELARGNGYATHVLYPSVLAYGDAAGTVADPSGTYPEMNRHPGFALALAPFVAALGATDAAVHFGLAAFFGLWVLAAFLVIDRRLGRLPAVATAAFLALNPAFVVFFVPGGFADILFAALVLAFLHLATRDDDPGAVPAWRWFLVGLLGSCAWMVRFNFSLVALLGAAALLWPRPDRRRAIAAAALLLGFAFGCAPYNAWHTWVFGSTDSPPSLWNLLDGCPGYEAPWKQYRTLSVHDVFANGTWRILLAEKFPYLAFLAARNLPGMLLAIVPFPFFVVALFRRGRPAGQARLLAVSTVAFLAMLGVLSFIRFENWVAPGGRELNFRYYIWFLPILVAFGAQEAAELLAARARAVRVGALALLAALQLAYLFAYAGPLQDVYRTQGRFDAFPAVQALARLDRDGAIRRDLPVFTNVPAHVGWYLDRPALLMTTTPDEVGPLWARHPVSAVLFTKLDIGEPALFPAWTKLFQDAEATKAFLAATGLRVAYADDTSLLLVASAASATVPATAQSAAAAATAPATGSAASPTPASPPAAAPATPPVASPAAALAGVP